MRDLTGREVYARTFDDFVGIFQEEINVTGVAKGLYLMEIVTVDGVGYGKVLVQ